MGNKILIATLPIGNVLTAGEAASIVARTLRAHDRTLSTEQIVQLPLVDGGDGTIDFLVTNSLGSFLEVEATDAAGSQAIVPIGFAGDDGKLSVIEMQLISGVAAAGISGTTYGVGELIQDALDESAFSILLGLKEPIARDAGFGIAAALGVKFYDEAGLEIEFASGPVDLSRIARIDPSGRSFQLLSSRFFVARSGAPIPSDDLQFHEEYSRLAELMRRDCGIEKSNELESASGIELGLSAFLNATIGEGTSLVLEASGIRSVLQDAQTSCILFSSSVSEFREQGAETLLNELAGDGRNIVFLVQSTISTSEREQLLNRFPNSIALSLRDVPLFQAPLASNAGPAEVRRDILMRIEKGMPMIYERLTATNVSEQFTRS